MSQAAQMPETTHIPMTFRPRGGKTVIVLPDGSRGVVRREATTDNTMIKVIARGFRWQRLLYDGTYATIEDLAAAEKINPSYVSRILRLAYLSPTVVQAILEGSHPAWLTMKDLLRPLPSDWAEQERLLLRA
ncbi:MAG: hypothetical protein RLZZ153_1173 [Pseudomonadota bacterium]|jgi:hypothetical protein